MQKKIDDKENIKTLNKDRIWPHTYITQPHLFLPRPGPAKDEWTAGIDHNP